MVITCLPFSVIFVSLMEISTKLYYLSIASEVRWLSLPLHLFHP